MKVTTFVPFYFRGHVWSCQCWILQAGEDSLRRSGLGYTIVRPGPLQVKFLLLLVGRTCGWFSCRNKHFCDIWILGSLKKKWNENAWLLETCSGPKNVLGRQIGVSTSLMTEASMAYIVSITAIIFTFSCYSQHNYHDIHLLISFSDIIGSTTHACTHVYSSLDFTSTSTIPSYIYIPSMGALTSILHI